MYTENPIGIWVLGLTPYHVSTSHQVVKSVNSNSDLTQAEFLEQILYVQYNCRVISTNTCGTKKVYHYGHLVNLRNEFYVIFPLEPVLLKS